MKNYRLTLLLFISVLFLSGNLLAQDYKADDILGIWFNEEKDAKVEIYKENGKYYGKVIWLNEPNEPATGLPKLDDENEDESLQQPAGDGTDPGQGFYL